MMCTYIRCVSLDVHSISEVFLTMCHSARSSPGRTLLRAVLLVHERADVRQVPRPLGARRQDRLQGRLRALGQLADLTAGSSRAQFSCFKSEVSLMMCTYISGVVNDVHSHQMYSNL